MGQMLIGETEVTPIIIENKDYTVLPSRDEASNLSLTTGQTYTVPYDCEIHAYASNSEQGELAIQWKNSTGRFIFSVANMGIDGVVMSLSKLFRKGDVLYVATGTIDSSQITITPLRGDL